MARCFKHRAHINNAIMYHNCDILQVRAHVTRHVHEPVFDFFIANHLWDLNDQLYWASKSNKNNTLDTIKYLVLIGANVHYFEDFALRCAADNGFLDRVKYLVSVGANVHANHEDAITGAAYRGHLDCVKYLVSVGADIQQYGEHIIRWAINKGHAHVVKYLISVNKDLDMYNMYCTSDGPFGDEIVMKIKDA